jgi:hypothetical protein
MICTSSCLVTSDARAWDGRLLDHAGGVRQAIDQRIDARGRPTGASERVALLRERLDLLASSALVRCSSS